MFYKPRYESLEVTAFEHSEAGVKAILKALGTAWRRADLDDPAAGVLLTNGQLIKPGDYLVKFPNSSFDVLDNATISAYFMRDLETERAHEGKQC